MCKHYHENKSRDININSKTTNIKQAVSSNVFLSGLISYNNSKTIYVDYLESSNIFLSKAQSFLSCFFLWTKKLKAVTN